MFVCLVFRFFKHEVRYLSYLSDTLDSGNVCPACSGVWYIQVHEHYEYLYVCNVSGVCVYSYVHSTGKKTSLHALLMMLSLAKACDHWLKPVITFHCATKTCLKSPCRTSINLAGHETSSTQGNHMNVIMCILLHRLLAYFM